MLARPLRPVGRSSDQRLARRASRGDEEALAAIFERYRQELYRFCLGLLGEPQDAQDALQNTMVKVLRALPGEEREIALRPWLYRIAHNEAVDLRRGRRETRALDGHLLDARSSVDETAEQRERLQSLLRDMGDLPERQRAVLVMRELSGLDFADIAATLGTSGAVVRQTLYEARRNLEQMDFGRGLRCEAVTRVLSDADGRISSRRAIRAHLRNCPDCRHFQGRIRARREALAGIALPAGTAGGLLQSALSGLGGSEAGGFASTLGAGAAKSVGTVGALKAAAAIAAVAVVGTVAVERGPHDRRAAADALPPPSPRPSHFRQTPPAIKISSPRGSRSAAPGQKGSTPFAAVGSPAATRPSSLGPSDRRRPGAPAGGDSPSHAGAATTPDEVPAQAPPLGGRTATPAAPQGSAKPAKQASSAKQQARREEKATEAKPQSGPEHPAHPEHPEHPVHPQKPSSPLAGPEEGPGKAETTPAPTAEEAPESIFRGPRGKAKGYEREPSG